MVTVYAGTLAECADDMSEGSFWDSYFTLYELALAGDYDPYIITTTIAGDLDLDPDELYACTEEIRQVRTDVELAQEHGIQGTPAVMIRYSDGDPEFVELDGVTFNRGSVPEEVLRQVIESAPAAEATPESSN
jgi:protein-disulfide isomerase